MSVYFHIICILNIYWIYWWLRVNLNRSTLLHLSNEKKKTKKMQYEYKDGNRALFVYPSRFFHLSGIFLFLNSRISYLSFQTAILCIWVFSLFASSFSSSISSSSSSSSECAMCSTVQCMPVRSIVVDFFIFILLLFFVSTNDTMELGSS